MSDDADLAETALFQKLKATPVAPNPLDEKREAQRSFDEVLSKLGSAAVAPEDGESNAHYLAVLGTQAAAYGPEERRKIDRVRLANEAPAALAEIAQEDLTIARVEIERPYYSLKPGETREVRKIDRSGRPFIEFYNRDGPGFWMEQFKDQMVHKIAGGSAGIATDRGSGYYDFRKSRTNPELRDAMQRAAYMDTAEYRIAEAYRAVGLEPPDMAQIKSQRR